MFRKVKQNGPATTAPQPGQRSEAAEQRPDSMGILDVFIAKCRSVTVPAIPPPAGLGRPPGYQVGENGAFDATLDGRR